MKRSLIFLFTSLLIFSNLFILSCTIEEDDDETITYRVENNALISIENNQSEFNVGDTIFIETSIEPNQETTNNQSINITDLIYESENGPLTFNATLYRENSLGSLIRVPLDNANIIQDLGTVTSNDNSQFPVITIESYYDGNTFYSRFGINLTEAGTYFINSENLNNAFIRISGGDYNLGYINIESKIVNSDIDGFYQFTVN